MTQVRFATLVATCGKPEAHLLWTDPAKDSGFQKAVKAQRVMTVFQSAAGSKADHGEVGFVPGSARQFLVFPKSLRKAAGKSVTGIKYDLFEPAEDQADAAQTRTPAKPRAKASKPHQHARARPPAKPKKPDRPAKSVPRAKKKPGPAPKSKIVPFPAPEKKDANGADQRAVGALQKQVRAAMRALEQGKAVAAYNLLKKIVEP